MLWFKEKKKEKEKGLTRGIYNYLYPRGKKQKLRIDEMGDQSWDNSKKKTHLALLWATKFVLKASLPSSTQQFSSNFLHFVLLSSTRQLYWKLRCLDWIYYPWGLSWVTCQEKQW